MLSVVGEKDAGKTAVAEELVRILRNKGFKVGAIKHSEKAEPRLEPEGVDTLRLREAGADAVAFVSGEETLMLTLSLPLKTTLRLFETLFDIVVVEGLREGAHPKVAVDDGDYENIITRVDVEDENWKADLEEAVSEVEMGGSRSLALFADGKALAANRFVEKLFGNVARALFGALRGTEDASVVTLMARLK